MRWNELSPAVQRAVRWPSPAALALELSHGAWKLYDHLAFISRTIRDAIVKGNARIIINIPPQHGKSELCSVWTPAWLLAMRRQSRCGILTYGHQFSAKWGRSLREVIRENGDTLGLHLNPEKDAANEFELLEGGSVLCTGVGGVLRGHGFDLIVVDDPHKNRAEVESDVVRTSIREWWLGDVLNRFRPGCSVVIIMQRLHEDDLVGFLTSPEYGGEFEHIVLPAIAEEGDPIGREPGEALWPERYPIETLDEFKRTMQTYDWVSQYEQRPSPAGGSVFRRQDFRYWADAGNHYNLDGKRVAKGACWIAQTVDTALTTKTTSDYTVVLTFAVTPERNVVVLDVARARLEGPDQMPFLEAQRAKWSPSWVGVEDKGSGMWLNQEAARTGQPFHRLKADRDKFTRSITAAIMYENHKVFHPSDPTADWVGAFEHELLSFPNGAHDDQVDVLAYACQEVGMPAPEIVLL